MSPEVALKSKGNVRSDVGFHGSNIRARDIFVLGCQNEPALEDHRKQFGDDRQLATT
jgi:hypothetical protein